jgi:hypothetical protein
MFTPLSPFQKNLPWHECAKGWQAKHTFLPCLNKFRRPSDFNNQLFLKRIITGQQLRRFTSNEAHSSFQSILNDAIFYPTHRILVSSAILQGALRPWRI